VSGVRQTYKTARCILYRGDEFLLAVHSSMWRATHRRWGLPGGQIERGESPEDAVIREVEEELSLYLPRVLTVGPYPYKKHLHMVYAAEVNEPISDWDDSELLDVRWFGVQDIRQLSAENRLHASYELHAIETLLELLTGRAVPGS
jgi:NADH pyrophosphatase NudC (nudix superfamily)